jgi:hypothetical protein
MDGPYDFYSDHPANAGPYATIYGRISSNQFAGEHEAFMHAAIDKILTEEEARATFVAQASSS